MPGLLQDVADEGSLIPSLEADQLDEFIDTVALGRMKKKLLGAKESLEGGVSRVMVGDARGASPVTDALSGKGTAIS